MVVEVWGGEGTSMTFGNEQTNLKESMWKPKKVSSPRGRTL